MEQYGKISAAAHYVPEKIVTNDDLAKFLETSDEWISSRTGIKERRIAVDLNTSDLCIKVAEQLLEKSSTSPEDLDFILVATMSPDYTSPSTACIVQGAIGAKNAFAFDISAACSGFIYALATAEGLIMSGAKKGLVIGGEKTSKLMDWTDRSTAVLFGDGAGGVLYSANEEKTLLKKQLSANGSRGDSLTSGFMPDSTPFSNKESEETRYLTMNGRNIFDFALNDVAKSLKSFIQDEEVDYFLLHQANQRILNKMSKKIGKPIEQFPHNMEKYGNTSAASIPILLSELVEQETLHLNGTQKVVLTGFGGGLTWGHLLITL